MHVLSKNIKNIIFFSGEIFIFFTAEKKSLYIAWAGFCNVVYDCTVDATKESSLQLELQVLRT